MSNINRVDLKFRQSASLTTNRYFPKPCTLSSNPKACIFFIKSVAGRAVIDNTLTTSPRPNIFSLQKTLYKVIILFWVFTLTLAVSNLANRLFFASICCFGSECAVSTFHLIHNNWQKESLFSKSSISALLQYLNEVCQSFFRFLILTCQII